MSYQQYRPNKFNLLPPVVKNLLIINGLFYLATIAFDSSVDGGLVNFLGLHYFESDAFKPHQLVSYMFMHDPTSFSHLFFNMFALWMFGNALENVWGPKRFLIFYMITGIGAGLSQMAVTYFALQPLYSQIQPELLEEIRNNGTQILMDSKNFIDPIAAKMNLMINTPTVGASGSVFGVLLAFGMLFPNTLLYIYFLIPMKAKYFVILYGAIELFLAIQNSQGDNVAHFAHLGGMLFGFILIKIWQKRSNRFY